MSCTKLGLGLEMHKTINRRAHPRKVAIACARATSPLPSAADGGHDCYVSPRVCVCLRLTVLN